MDRLTSSPNTDRVGWRASPLRLRATPLFTRPEKLWRSSNHQDSTKRIFFVLVLIISFIFCPDLVSTNPFLEIGGISVSL
ncbi:hypothetical protein SORBI_3009G209150 [Sorghum bicolor]|uniref:Uncharacterized protein n=1 Tax=Sorghum bicolor TaxID=4558 RepID=C5Z1F9_SORBI|nr:hypothetical protein SORBI_3009G209150 [Sorghum bicolor]